MYHSPFPQRLINLEMMKLLRENVRQCYRREGVNHHEKVKRSLLMPLCPWRMTVHAASMISTVLIVKQCRKDVEAYFAMLQKREGNPLTV